MPGARFRLGLGLVGILFAAAALSACGREGNPYNAPDLPRFCELAGELERGAAAAFARLDPKATQEAVLDTLRTFAEQHRADYIELEQVAPPEIREALQTQRELRAELFERFDENVYQKTIGNGRRIRQYEQSVCANA